MDLSPGNGMGAMIASAKVAQIVRSAARAVIYAKLRYVVIFILVFGSAAMATGSNVVQQIKSHLPSINLTGWIKPLLRSMLPNLQADATNSTAPNPLDTTAVRAQPDANLKVDADSFDRIPLASQTASAMSASTVAPKVMVASPAKTPAAVATVSPITEPLNAVAEAILNPPLYSSAARKPPQTALADLAIGNTDSSAAAETTANDAAKTIQASGSSFTLGAGGGGGGGTPAVYTMPANASLHYQSMTIGASSDATFFHQVGGVNQIAGTLTLGRSERCHRHLPARRRHPVRRTTKSSAMAATARSSKPTASMSPTIPSRSATAATAPTMNQAAASPSR